MKRFFFSFFGLLPCLVLLTGNAHAQMQPNSITVSPSLLQLDLSVDKPEGTLTYFNTSNDTIDLTLSASDFAPLEDGYKLSFLSQKDADNYKYSLSSWIDFGAKTLTLPPHSSKTVTVFIQKEKLTTGGHYATILAQMAGNTTDTLQIQGILASLLFVRANTGREKDDASIASLLADSDTLSFPKNMIFRFNNTGDTTLTPYGLITITDPFHRLVAKSIVNENSLQSLPESIRRFEVPLRFVALAYIPGVYTAHLTIHFGKTTINKDQTISFFSQGQIPYIQIFITIAFLYGMFLFVRRFLPRKRTD
ncbi:MAG: hypothetical protein ACREGI_04060 [Candidatus Levyibacteriota bacterium]